MKYFNLLILSFSFVTPTSQQGENSKTLVTTLAYGSCNKPSKTESNLFWKQISDVNPDRLLLLGDNIYADKLSVGGFKGATWASLKSIYEDLARDQYFNSLIEKIGGMANVLATFDDHDYGINNGDKTFPLRNLSQQLFYDFFEVPNDSIRRQRSGVYSSTLYQVDHEKMAIKIILLDTRSNKDKFNMWYDNYLYFFN